MKLEFKLELDFLKFALKILSNCRILKTFFQCTSIVLLHMKFLRQVVKSVLSRSVRRNLLTRCVFVCVQTRTECILFHFHALSLLDRELFKN